MLRINIIFKPANEIYSTIWTCDLFLEVKYLRNEIWTPCDSIPLLQLNPKVIK